MFNIDFIFCKKESIKLVVLLIVHLEHFLRVKLCGTSYALIPKLMQNSERSNAKKIDAVNQLEQKNKNKI